MDGYGLRKNAMTVKKLSDSDKRDILDLYRQTGETTSTLAERYDVSNSTISRLLKSTLPEEEYEALIASKRAARTSGGATSHSPLFSEPPDVLVTDPLTEVEPKQDEDSKRQEDLDTHLHPKSTPAAKRLRRRSSAISTEETSASSVQVQLQLLDTPSDIEGSSTSQFADTPLTIDRQAQASGGNLPPELLERTRLNQDVDTLDLDDEAEEVRSSASPFNQDVGRQPVIQPKLLHSPASIVDSNSTQLDQDSDAKASTLAQMLGEDLLDESEELMELEENEDLEDLDEDDLERETPVITRRVLSELLVQVLPLSEATLPKTCYLVIDRASELITRPLRDFGELGQIPTQEVQQKTLPVFDNHRVARRFSTKRDRVIKVPDSRMFQKARSHLQAKGITRLLVDGQVYSLLK